MTNKALRLLWQEAKVAVPEWLPALLLVGAAAVAIAFSAAGVAVNIF